MLLDDLGRYLSPLLGFSVQKRFLQKIPDTVLALRETGGFPSQHVHGTWPGQAILDEPTVQVVTRAKDYVTAMTTARQAYSLLDGLRDVTLNRLQYYFVRALQPPFFPMREENHRFLCVFNVHVQRSTV